MSKLPTYYLWEPSIESGGTIISVYLTRGSCIGTPEKDKRFFEDVLSNVGIEVPLNTWSVEPFVTRYYNSKDWEECWDARLMIVGKVKIPHHSNINGIPLYTMPTLQVPLTKYFPVRVLANFTSRQAALKCREALKEYASTAKWNEIHFERYFIRNLGKRQKQLLIDVATIDHKNQQRAIRAAEKAELICKNLGGEITFSKDNKKDS